MGISSLKYGYFLIWLFVLNTILEIAVKMKERLKLVYYVYTASVFRMADCEILPVGLLSGCLCTNVQSQKYISRVLTSEFVLSQVVVTVTRTIIVKRGPQRDTAAPAVTSNT